MNDHATPNPPRGSRMKGQTLRLVSSFLVGLLVMLVTGLLGIALTKAVLASIGSAILFWVFWLVVLRFWLRKTRHPAS